jgi:hypothetical protein
MSMKKEKIFVDEAGKKLVYKTGKKLVYKTG